MSKPLLKIFVHPFLLILLAVLIKIPLFFTRHLQEDSFITWRVARNLLDFGVIGFNGTDRISASTTHLYVIVSALFQVVFGDHFIYPLLIFSTVLFAIGTWWLGRILFRKNLQKQGVFVLLLNMVPPALTASCLGMEYGILFFLYCGLLYFGIAKRKNGAFFIFPVLLLWTRLDAVIFLGIFFVAECIIKRKINIIFLIGGLLGLGSVVLFNYFYFGEIVNHTITAKKIAYKNLMPNSSWQFILYQWAYYGGLIKKYSLFALLVFIAFLVFLGYFVLSVFHSKQISFQTKVLVISMAVFALLKITVFAFFKAYFDWYYWLPRVFLFAVVLFYLLRFAPLKSKVLIPLLFVSFSFLYVFQWLQSYAIGYMEQTQRVEIAQDILRGKTGPTKSILLEPAGKIPFYTQLYTYDEVGLVNTKITAEMLKDEKFWWINSVRDFKPDYILTIAHKADSGQSYYQTTAEDKTYFHLHYTLVKSYPIAEIHQNAPAILRWVYSIRPIGKDYYLYRKI